ncbi:MAG: hypothetical protein A2X49_04735 [Lentisphaerae bacterium GWF2_52_8]|nr:MAG: hypothetical protein A2X49_04735 [Lentisphaerae bacterium GWF2_52_8]
MNSISLAKYLRTKGRLLPLEGGGALSRNYRQAVLIPVFAERDFLPATLQSLSRNSSASVSETLILLVLNNPVDANPEKVEENLQSLSALRAGDYPQTLRLCWIDAASPGRELPAGGGVGLARKIGMDSALQLLDWNAGPLLLSLDADTLVGPDYLDAVRGFFDCNPKMQSATVNFAHLEGNSEDENSAITSYELYMRYHLAGLRMAHSPYAYHSLGSAISCRAGAYVKAGGMRERSGGEDFYFLQALRKTSGPVGQITGTCVRPSARPSDRVPIGTGPRMRSLLAGEGISVPSPAIFLLLRSLFEKIESLREPEWAELGEGIFRNSSPELESFLRKESFPVDWPKIHANTPPRHEARKAAFHTWFDALRTLQFIHHCEKEFPSLHSRRERVVEAFIELFELNGKILSGEAPPDEKGLLLLLRSKNI